MESMVLLKLIAFVQVILGVIFGFALKIFWSQGNRITRLEEWSEQYEKNSDERYTRIMKDLEDVTDTLRVR